MHKYRASKWKSLEMGHKHGFQSSFCLKSGVVPPPRRNSQILYIQQLINNKRVMRPITSGCPGLSQNLLSLIQASPKKDSLIAAK